MRRWPWTFWNSVSIELWRLVLLSTGVLVCVIAFGASVKPISDGILDAVSAAKFIVLAIPPMLAYAMPFASGLAATLVYHRLSTDNEIGAAQAGGMSHRTLLVPAAVTAFVLTAGVLVLNQQVIPRFLRSMQSLITFDLARWMAQETERGRSIDYKGRILFADAAHRSGPDEASGATDRLMLSKFAWIEVRNGEVVSETTAKRADLWFFPGEHTQADVQGQASPEGASLLFMRLHNVLYTRKNENTVRVNDEATSTWNVPVVWADNPKYLTFDELLSLKDRPEKMNWIDQRRRDLAYQLANRRCLGEMKQAIDTAHTLRLVDDAGREVVVKAGGMEWDGQKWLLRPLQAGGEIEVRMSRPADAGTSVLPVVLAAKACTPSIDLGPDRTARKLEIRLDLTRVRVMVDEPGEAGRTGGAGSERAVFPVAGLSLPSHPEKPLLAMSVRDLLAESHRADIGVGPDAVTGTMADLEMNLGYLRRAVLAKQHERWALAASCFCVVMTGALTALRLSRKLPLSVYLWTFFPAMACLVTISGGTQTYRRHGDLGLLLLWGGVAGLAIYAWWMYRRLVPPGQQRTARA